MSQAMTEAEVRKLLAEELAKLDPHVREQARNAALAAVNEASTLEKVAGSPVFRDTVRAGAAAYVKTGSVIAFGIAVVAALPMVVPYCSSQQALNQTKAAAQEAAQAAKVAQDAASESARTADASSTAATAAKAKADEAVSAAQRALDDALKDAPAATQAFVRAINESGSPAIQSATDLLKGVQALVKVNEQGAGAMQLGDLLVCWGSQVVEPRSAKSPDRQFVVRFAQQFEGDPLVVCSAMNDGGDQGFVVTDRNLGDKEFNGRVTEVQARPRCLDNRL